MQRIFSFFITLIALSVISCQSTAVSTKTKRFSLTFTDSVSQWTLGAQTPPFTDDSLYPLIVYLHGGIGTQQTNKGVRAYDMFNFIADTMSLFLASPSANRKAPWWSSTGTERILFTVKTMVERYPIDTNKIFLAGVSDGATALFPVASLSNHPFAGFIGSAGYPLPFQKQLSIENMKKTPLKLYICENDRLYSSGNVREYYNFLKRNGVPIEFTVQYSADHGFEFRESERAVIVNRLNSWKKIDREKKYE